MKEKNPENKNYQSGKLWQIYGNGNSIEFKIKSLCDRKKFWLLLVFSLIVN